MICFLALQRPVWQRVGAMEMSLKPASIQSFSSAWSQMVCTSKERSVGRCWAQGGDLQCCYLIVIDLCGQHCVTLETGHDGSLSLALAVRLS